ncbi:hypothetical protein FB567DRAFT_555804 [Paraphoma chrysanthemicola]|uniref:Uncharacterized protein n=1 Tax=Paraphoma chrysanthemicola TaxID=798071 RepID=A0A8K0VRT5_9PLEO|nr:hypothetical protein FB567DRAFT_555804 [Paraphoma chrysanthemicola]
MPGNNEIFDYFISHLSLNDLRTSVLRALLFSLHPAFESHHRVLSRIEHVVTMAQVDLLLMITGQRPMRPRTFNRLTRILAHYDEFHANPSVQGYSASRYRFLLWRIDIFPLSRRLLIHRIRRLRAGGVLPPGGQHGHSTTQANNHGAVAANNIDVAVHAHGMTNAQIMRALAVVVFLVMYARGWAEYHGMGAGGGEGAGA